MRREGLGRGNPSFSSNTPTCFASSVGKPRRFCLLCVLTGDSDTLCDLAGDWETLGDLTGDWETLDLPGELEIICVLAGESDTC
mmetsp:Transcript_14097/g.15716  ORF Transcript_14097/g.15716 Transcript_14097/m.15716 type:complete len:84 (+) Transcript_14097:689-940(+)